jgi:hypothetical protein
MEEERGWNAQTRSGYTPCAEVGAAYANYTQGRRRSQRRGRKEANFAIVWKRLKFEVLSLSSSDRLRMTGFF